MALDGTGVALTDRHALHVDLLAYFEEVDADHGAGGQLGGLCGIDLEFLEDFTGLNAGFCEMTCQRLRHARSTARTECHLNGDITIRFNGLDLRHAVVGHVQHGNGNRIPFCREDTGHANLATYESKAHRFLHSRLRLVGANLQNAGAFEAFSNLKRADFFAQMREKPCIIARPFVFRKQSMT